MDRNGSSGATGAGVVGGDVNSELRLAPGGNPERHPTIDNVNALLAGLWCELLGHGIVVGKTVERQS